LAGFRSTGRFVYYLALEAAMASASARPLGLRGDEQGTLASTLQRVNLLKSVTEVCATSLIRGIKNPTAYAVLYTRNYKGAEICTSHAQDELDTAYTSVPAEV